MTDSTPVSAPRLWALVPCAGTGSRAGGVLPKQYQPVAGQPLVLHTLAAFAALARICASWVVVAPGDGFFDALPGRSFEVADCGGATRAESVGNGLAALLAAGAEPDDWVLVHDAARCLVTPEQIRRLIDACEHDDVGGLLAQPAISAAMHAKALAKCQGLRGVVVLFIDLSVRWGRHTVPDFRSKSVLVGF